MALAGPQDVEKLVKHTKDALDSNKRFREHVRYITTHETPYLRMTSGNDEAALKILTECIDYLEFVHEQLVRVQQGSSPPLTTNDYHRIKGDVDTANDRGQSTYKHFNDKKRYAHAGEFPVPPAAVGVPGGNPPQVGVPGGNPPQVGVPGGNPPQVGVPGGNPPMAGSGKPGLEEYVAPGTPLDQYIANQTPIHTAGDVRGRTPIHIVTN